MTDERLQKELPSSTSPASASVAAQRGANGGDRLPAADARDKPGSRRISRRRLIGMVGAAGLSAGLGERLFDGGAAAATGRKAAAARTSKKRLSQWMMVIDLRVCDGCGACTSACQDVHYLPKDIEWIKVYEMTGASGQKFFMPKPCMMCEDPPCVPVCPVSATYRTDEGHILIDQDACIGCRFCMAACPYESRYFNTTDPPKVPHQVFPRSPEWPVPQVKDTVGKCILCAARLSAGTLPACVEVCPMGALYIGDLTTDVAVNSLGDTIKVSEFLRAHDAVRLKEELGTNPRVYYIPGHGQELPYT